MNNSWFQDELKEAQFGDKRLSARFVKLVKNLSEKAEGSLPKALDTWTEAIAGYRFFLNKKVTADKIFLPHKEATIARIKKEKVVLLPQDTTEINYSSKKDIEGLGYLSNEMQKGILLHPVLAVTPERICLGVLSNKMWVRESIGGKGPNRTRPIEEKESNRWLKGFELAEEIAKEAPDTLIVSIADREGDIYEFFQSTDGIREDAGAHWLIRSHYNRVAVKNKDVAEKQGLWDAVRKQNVAATIEFELPKRSNNKARRVKQEIRFMRVTLSGSRRKGGNLPPLDVSAVLATETNSPKGEKPIEWLLISSLPVSDAKEATKLLEWYLCRWDIELFFKVLKSGCNIERLQLEHVQRLFKCISLYMIIAWRIMYIKNIGRKYPEQSCTLVFSENEWKAVYCRLNKGKAIPNKPPNLYDMVVMVARLGGFLARKGDGYPGIKTLWEGLQRMHDCTQTWENCMRINTCV